MAKKNSTPAVPALHEKEYAAIGAAYSLLFTGAGMLRTAAAALESKDEHVSRAGIWETVQAAHGQILKANDALDGHTDSPLFEQIEAARQPLFDVLDLVFAAAHALDDDDFPSEGSNKTSEHPESTPLRLAAHMAARDKAPSVAHALDSLQAAIMIQRNKAA